MIPKISGNKIINSLAWLNHPYEFLDQAVESTGLTFLLDMPTMGEALVTGDPAYIAEIIKNKQLIGGRGTQALRPLLGDDSLIILEGEPHNTRRQIMTPFFKTSNIQKFDNLTLNATLDEISRLNKNEVFSIFTIVRRITLKVIIRLIFGQMTIEKEEYLTRLVTDYCFSFRNPLFLFVKALHFNFGRFSPWGRLNKNKKALYDFIITEIKQRQEHLNGNSSGLLDELIFMAKKSSTTLTNDSIFNEVLSLLLFGHDTSAVTMAWLFFHVYKDEDVLAKLKIETTNNEQVIKKLGQDKNSYLKASIFESMRLCPVVVHLTRVAEKETTLRGHHLKADSKVLPCIYLAHHNPDVFSSPYSYNPGRFLSQSDYHYSFFPFGFGARKCIGEQMAMRQMQIILATFIRETNLTLDPQYTIKPERQMLLIGPSNGTMMRC